jgi:ABC-type nitrate/sulfonate/bicarbonate transport system substrate-binding protein
MRRFGFFLIAGLLGFPLTTPQLVWAADGDTLRLGAGSIVTQMAVKRGLFEKYGLKVQTVPSGASDNLRRMVATGEVDLADYGVDNALAIPPGDGSNLVILFGSTSLATHLIVQPDITSLAQIKGRTLLVDAPNTQNALALRKTLLAAGLKADDYKLQTAGGTPARIDAMKKNPSLAGTMAAGPSMLQALSAGLKDLTVTTPHTGPLLFYAGYGLRSRVQGNGDKLARYIAGHIEAVRWMRDPAQKEAVLMTLMSELKLGRADAEAAYAEGISTDGWEVDGAVDPAKLTNVFKLRADVEGGSVQPVANWIDDSYRVKALALVASKNPR